MTGKHGGKRPGAGRPKKSRTPTEKCESSYQYLQMVAMGEIEPDALRISAAKACLPFEEPKKRAKPKSLTPKALYLKEQSAIENSRLLDFQERAEKIRRKYKYQGGCPND